MRQGGEEWGRYKVEGKTDREGGRDKYTERGKEGER